MNTFNMPVVTALAGGALGLVLMVLSALVVVQRAKRKVAMGPGEDTSSPLYVAIRSQANFAEYVPLSLVLIGLLELHGGATLMVKVLACALVLARIIHPIGMRIPGANPLRAGGFVLSLLVLLVSSVAVLVAFAF